MSRLNFRGTVVRLATVIPLLWSITVSTPALARDRCSTRTIAGRWMFATEVGQIDLSLFGIGTEGEAVAGITAIGTMNIDRNGNVSGEFDVTVAQFAFLSDNEYGGSVTVDPDCTGTLTFVTSAGTMRTDSIAVLSPREMWGMSQDILNPWTYRVRRISGRRDNDDDDD